MNGLKIKRFSSVRSDISNSTTYDDSWDSSSRSRNKVSECNSHSRQAAFEYSDGTIPELTIARNMKCIVEHRNEGSQKRPWIKLLGEGLCSHAWTIGKKVAKTNVFSGQASVDAQATWLEWCAENQDNPTVPKIHYLYIFKNGREYFVVMEKLEKFRPVNFRSVYPQLPQSGDLVYALSEEIRGITIQLSRTRASSTSHEDFVDEVLEESEMMYNSRFYSTRYAPREARQRLELTKEIAPVKDVMLSLIGIASIHEKVPCRIDMHDDNYMFRKVGQSLQLVILDPIINN